MQSRKKSTFQEVWNSGGLEPRLIRQMPKNGPEIFNLVLEDEKTAARVMAVLEVAHTAGGSETWLKQMPKR